MSGVRVAIVHEWLSTYAGSERVLEQMIGVFPDADLFAVVDFLPDDRRGFVLGKMARTTFIQRLPFARTKFRAYLPLMPLAIEQLDLSAYDVVITSSHAVAKGVITGPDQLHLCMCYSPIRYAWDLQHQYLRETGATRGPKSWIARALLHQIRLWDARTAHGVDEFIAISHFIARRVKKVYGRSSTVIYPPVSLDRFRLHEKKEDYYLTASRLVPYKKVDMIVEAFASMPDKKLIVIGDGPEMAKVRDRAGPNVTIMGVQSDEVLRSHMQRAKAFVFAAEEDFGIVVLEAQACGTPVIAYAKGGALETVRPLGGVTPTGVFFREQTVACLRDAVARFESSQWDFDAAAIRMHAARFGEDRFRDEFRSFVAGRWDAFQQQRVGLAE